MTINAYYSFLPLPVWSNDYAPGTQYILVLSHASAYSIFKFATQPLFHCPVISCWPERHSLTSRWLSFTWKICSENSSCFGFGFLATLLISSFSLLFPNDSFWCHLPADSRQPLEIFHFKSKQCVGYKERSWEYSRVKLYLILIIYFSVVSFELTSTLWWLQADSNILSHVKTLHVHEALHVIQVAAFFLSAEMTVNFVAK